MRNILITSNSINKNDEFFNSVDSNWYRFFKNDLIIPIPNNPSLFDNYSTALNISAIILSGGGDIKSNNISKDQHDSKRELVEEALIKFSIKENIPLIGICRGMQKILSYTHKEIKFIKNKVKIKDNYQLVSSSTSENVPKGSRICFNNYSIEKDKKIEENWNILNIDQNKNVLSVNSKKHKILCLMWHPEREMSDYDLFKSFLS